MFYIALCDDEWQADRNIDRLFIRVKRSGLQLKVCLF